MFVSLSRRLFKPLCLYEIQLVLIQLLITFFSNLQGIQNRVVSCIRSDNGERMSAEHCSKSEAAPASEQICAHNPDCQHQVPQSSNVEHRGEADDVASYDWRKGEWSPVSKI